MKEFVITICDGTSCINKGSKSLHDVIREELEKTGLTDNVRINISGCLGMCDKGPIMVVYPGYTIYGGLNEEDVREIINGIFYLTHNGCTWCALE